MLVFVRTQELQVLAVVDVLEKAPAPETEAKRVESTDRPSGRPRKEKD